MKMLDSLFRSCRAVELFTDEACLQSMLDFEAALARAEAMAGVIPASAAPAIAAKCRVELLDQQKLSESAALAGNLAIPLVKQLKALVAAGDRDAASFVHWGATSQDVIDTATILQLQRASLVVAKNLTQLRSALGELADKHCATPIVGRTWMQHAVPTTLGFKFAGWLDALNRHAERLSETQARCFVLQFGGAVGTLAALGSLGEAVAQNLAKELNLPTPPMPWHSHRDRMTEVATTLGLLTGTLGKIARDIALHMQIEIDEIREPSEEGRGGSSTMPHKRNPVVAAAILSAATRVPGLVSTMLSAMIQEDERGLGGWHAEWETLPEIVCLTAGATEQLANLVPRLELDVHRMQENLNLTKGVIFAEAITAALGEKIGRAAARQLIDAATQRAATEHRPLRDVIDSDPKIASKIPSAELDALFDARNYTGTVNTFIDRVLQHHESRRPKK